MGLLMSPFTGTTGHAGVLAIPDEVLRHRAILVLPNGTPFSEVVETYTREVLAFEPNGKR
jgi:PhoPQ-activated pathogenicity-related protein